MRPDVDGGSRRKEVFAGLLVTLMAFGIGLKLMPTQASEAAFAVPWAVLAAMTLDHLNGHGEFTTRRRGLFQAMFPPFLCLLLGAGEVADLVGGDLLRAGVLGLATLLEMAAMEALVSLLRPR